MTGPLVPGLRAQARASLWRVSRFYNFKFAYLTRVSMACSRGALNVATRHVVDNDPLTWEFSAFSQNGEDGIIDRLLTCAGPLHHYFVEIGAGDGLENNTAYLAFVKKYSGMMVEGNAERSVRAQQCLQALNWSVSYHSCFVTPANVRRLAEAAVTLEPDVLSLDIDGNDYHVAKALLAAGFRPKILCVEYNSAFGPARRVTIPYTEDIDYMRAHPLGLYYGASVGAWRTLLEAEGYRFVTVDSRGVNAFFVSPAVALPHGFEGLAFAENAGQRMRAQIGWHAQMQAIQHLPLVEV